MDKTLQFIAPDPPKAMETLNANLRRALRISPSQMDILVEQDNTEREAKVLASFISLS